MADPKKKINKPGMYDISAELYHSDPVVKPSLSSSIGRILINQTPRHAWEKHPRLNPDWEPDEGKEKKKNMEIGTAAHAVLLDDGRPIRIIKANSYSGYAAQRARKEAHLEGLVPVLEGDYAEVMQMVSEARKQLTAHETAYDAFIMGHPERTLIWKEKILDTVIWCRAMVDWLPPLGGWLNDYKTTLGSAEPGAWTARTLYPDGGDFQAAFYMRGYEKIYSIAPAGFRYVVQEQKRPYALSTVTLTEGDLDLSRKNVQHAMELWAMCIKADKWPGYPNTDHRATRAAWRENQILEREDEEQLIGKKQMFERMLKWQQPV